jgi:serine/threonine protein kinase
MEDHPFDPDDVAGSMSDRQSVDWAHAEARARSERQRRIVRALRDIAAISAPDPSAQLDTHSGNLPFLRWGQLELRARLGSGSFGEVFLAWDEMLAREVALKLFHERGSPGSRAPADFMEEARRLARIRQTNIVQVLGADSHEGRLGFWMEYIVGQNLEDMLDLLGPFDVDEACLIGQKLCRALAAVHGASLLHLDVKCQNVVRELGGRIVLLDFGAAAGTGIAAGSQSHGIGRAGTPLCLPPELLGGQVATVASDLYSLGVLLFRLVTGRFPVEGGTLGELRQAHADGRRLRVLDLRPDLPAPFVALLEKATDPEPLARHRSAGELERGLRTVLGIDRGVRRRGGRTLGQKVGGQRSGELGGKARGKVRARRRRSPRG